MVAKSRKEAQRLLNEQIQREHEWEEYSSAARINVESVEVIDDDVVEEGNITSRDARDMPMRECNTVDYNFTTQETKYLSTENTCVIDNIIGIYGEELKLNRDWLIKLNKDFHNVADEISEFDIEIKSTNNKEDVIKKLFQFEKEFDILYYSYYMDEINDLKMTVEKLKPNNNITNEQIMEEVQNRINALVYKFKNLKKKMMMIMNRKLKT